MSDKEMKKQLARDIGQAARAARAGLGLTQEDVAERIGVTSEFYARIERGGALPSVPTLVKIADILGLSADVMIGRTRDVSSTRLKRRKPVKEEESRDMRRLIRRLRVASPKALQLASTLVKALEEKKKS